MDRNEQAFEFTREKVPEVSKICKSLLHIFNIDFFECFRIFNDGKYFRLISGYTDYAKYYFVNIHDNGEIFTKALQNTPYHSEYCYLWPIKSLDTHLSLMHNFDLVHGISIFQREENYVDAYVFASSGQNDCIQDFFYTHTSLLKDFIKYFQYKAQNLLSHNKNKLAQYKNPIDIGYNDEQEVKLRQLRKNFYRQTNAHNFVKVNNKLIKLSNRERECLYYYTNGETMKRIARNLDISPRTVETYINNIKVKTGYNFKSDLIKLSSHRIKKFIVSPFV